MILVAENNISIYVVPVNLAFDILIFTLLDIIR
jgi:hypothetical protein